MGKRFVFQPLLPLLDAVGRKSGRGAAFCAGAAPSPVKFRLSVPRRGCGVSFSSFRHGFSGFDSRTGHHSSDGIARPLAGRSAPSPPFRAGYRTEQRMEQNMEKWVCNRCGYERTDKPRKNEICNHEGCKGRFRHHSQCKRCGEWFQAIEGKTLCHDCATEIQQYRIGMIDVVCTQCGNTFKRYKGDAKAKRQFCNISCLREYEKTKHMKRTCKECGKEFEVFRSSLEHTNASGNYCSRECYNKSMRLEGSKYFKGGFNRVKKEYFNGHQFCAICGTTKKIHIHHIIPFRLTQDNGVDNLVPLCSSHHAIFENISRPFIDCMDDMEEAKQLLNIIIRSRQHQTYFILGKIIAERSKHSDALD